MVGFVQADEAPYAAAFASLLAASHTASRPDALTQACAEKGEVPASLQVELPVSVVTSSEAQLLCGPSSACLLPAGAHLLMDASLNVASLVVQGHLQWDDETQLANEQWLCAGFVAVETSGTFNLSVADRRAFVYIKDNAASHASLEVRSFGGVGPSSRLLISGRPMRRTWSLLAEPVAALGTSLSLLHDPQKMGWRAGDRLMLAPTMPHSKGVADTARIVGFGSRGTVLLDRALAASYAADFVSVGGEVRAAVMSAEVINLDRNVVITGDALRLHSPCPAALPPATATGSSCTLGLHVAQLWGGIIRVEGARVERCGQRGVKGKYCLHTHLVGHCPTCSFASNAIEHAHQRGIVVHGTHGMDVRANVLADVRGAGIYLEDGNEMGNRIVYNVVICPFAREGPLRGCTVPGTDNDQADTALNQAGLWALPANNHFVGNRFSNSFNGLFIDANFDGGNGRGFAEGNECTSNQQLGRLEGNTNHGHARFGTYMLGAQFPRHVQQSLGSNGYTDLATCSAFTPEGDDRGASFRISNNVDYDNVFVGQYDLGDIQYHNHVSYNNLNLIYWKSTKNFANGCGAHISGGSFSGGNMALPDQGAFVIEQATFTGHVSLESNHHCNVGVTGALCAPTYVFDRVRWTATSAARWMYFQADANHYNGVFTLSPAEGANPHGTIFPAGFQSLCSHYFSYLLSLDDGSTCVTAASLALGPRYDHGILCRVPLRTLRVYTRGLSKSVAKALRVELWQGGVRKSTLLMPFHQVGSTKKQGYALPVAIGLGHEYRIDLEDSAPIPAEWILEFSEPLFGYRWGEETLQLRVAGRDCGAYVSSQHDRRAIWGGVADSDHLTDASWGHGACTAHPPMPHIDCSSVALPTLPDCPSCTSLECAVCAEARCGVHGLCTSRFLGGDLPVAQRPCTCDSAAWIGTTCELNPCSGEGEAACGAHGQCVADGGGGGWRCKCDQGHSGAQCETSCDAVCNGAWPYGCNAAVDAAFHLCGPGGGCQYVQRAAEANAGWCTYQESVAAGAQCDPSSCHAEDDCHTRGCHEGQCTAPTPLPDGTVCHGTEWGYCLGGQVWPQSKRGTTSAASHHLCPCLPLRVPRLLLGPPAVRGVEHAACEPRFLGHERRFCRL